MKKSKKGITLVELVICCAIIVMLGGACTAVLMSGENIYTNSSKAANAQMDVNVVQTYMKNLLPSSTGIIQTDVDTAKASTSGTYMYFDGDSFTIRIDGSDTTIRAISDMKYSMVKAGDPNSTNARVQFQYTVTTTDNSTLSGGFVLSNVSYDPDTMEAISDQELRTLPICIRDSDDT